MFILPDMLGDPHVAHATAALLIRAQKNDRAALDTLFARYRPIVERMAWKLYPAPCWDPTFDLDDLVQDTLHTAFTKLEQYRHESAFLTWLVSILESKAKDRWKWENRACRDQSRNERLPESDDATHTPRCETTPSFAARLNEEQARHMRALNEISDDDRKVLVLSVDCGLAPSDVAAELAISVDAAKQRLRRARARLALLLREPGEEPTHA